MRLSPPPSQCNVATAWATAYARTRILAMLPPRQVRVIHYTITAAPPGRGRLCGTVTLHKRLTLLRGQGDLHLAELRDFYHGTRLVAVHTARIGAELPISGRYTSTVTLPIPGNAPLGRYTVVSELYGRWGHGAPSLLAQSKAHFIVVP